MNTNTKYGVQPAKARLRASGLSVARAALAVGVTHAHLNGTIHGHIRPNHEVRERLPKVLGIPLDELFTTEILRDEPGAGRGTPRRFLVHIQRQGTEVDGVYPVEGVKDMERPPVRGESLTFSDGEWIVDDSWFDDGAFTVNLRRPRDDERTWPRATFNEATNTSTITSVPGGVVHEIVGVDHRHLT